MTAIAKSAFDTLIDNICQTHTVLQEHTLKVINQNLTIRNWLIGCYIVEYEQNGEDRAKYGTKLLGEMAKKLKGEGIKGLRERELHTCRRFYLIYPQIWRTVSAKLQTTYSENESPSLEGSTKILRTLSAKLVKEPDIAPELLLSRLSYSHFIELIRIEDSLERLFYEVESIKNNWNVRELQRAIESALFVRTGLSKNKHSVIAKIKNEKPVSFGEIIRNPYILEFMGLGEKTEYSESDLEQSIITHLQQFLMELGRGFCFEARQKRITFDNMHYRIDLVFYHRILKCHILVDLKIGAFTHADAGQMTLYLNYYETEEMTEGDNPPIGIILCANKNDTLVKYATAKSDDQLFVSKYMVELPNRKELEDFIKNEIR